MATPPPRRRSRSRSPSRLTSRPFTSTSPVTRVRPAGSRPRIARSVTLLPEPDSPRRARTVPASSEKVTPLTARTTPSRVSKATLRSRTLSSDMSRGPGWPRSYHPGLASDRRTADAARSGQADPELGDESPRALHEAGRAPPPKQHLAGAHHQAAGL